MAVLKVVLCGDGGVGKSTLTRAFLGREPPERLTVGADFYTYEYKGKKFLIVDIGGEERFRFILPLVAKKAVGLIYIFDLSRPSTLFSLVEWDNHAKAVAKPGAITFVIGNKADLERKVDNAAIEEVCGKINPVKYFESTAFNQEKVKKIFDEIFDMVVSRTS